jgi:two-component system nitrate/nitrite response regulator NarL
VIRVLVLGEVRLNREGIAALLAAERTLRVSTLAPTAGGVPSRAASVDVVVIDISALGGPSDIRRVVGTFEAPIVVLGVPEDEHQVIAFAELGVVGFVEREAALEDLVASIVSAARGHASLPPRIATTLLRRVSSLAARRSSPEIAALTMREREVVELIAEGLSNKEIAARLSIELATVKNHVHNILEKLEVSRRTDAVARLRIVENDADGQATLRLPAARSTTRSRAG